MSNFDFGCPHCGQMVTAEDAMGGQIVECPNCGRGIVVPNVTEVACTADGANAADGNVIPPEDFGEALAACRRDRVFEEVFTRAPRNARLFLGVKAYCLHFGKGFDDAEVLACLGDVEPDLSQDDIDFLLAHESDSLIRERLLAIKNGGDESSQGGGISVSDSYWEPRKGFFTRAFVQPLGIFLFLVKRCLVSCPSCGWIGPVVTGTVGLGRRTVRCCKCGGTMPLKESMASYTRVRDEGNSLSLEYSKRKKAREDFFAQAKAFEEDWEFFNELSSQRKINRIKEETDRLYRKMANLNADRIINSQRATAASNRAFGNTVGGTAGAFVSLAGSVAMWAEESSGKRLASQKMDIEQLIEHNEALIDHYNDIVEEFTDVEKDVARRHRLKSRCGYADESELPTLDLPLDHDRVERCKALDENMLDGNLLYFTVRFLIGLMCLIGIPLVLAFVNAYVPSWKHLEEQAIQFNRTHVVVPEVTPYEKTDSTVLENLAANGDLAAKWRLGMRLVYGDGCEQDVYRGTKLLKQSAEGGFGPAWTSLSAMYFSGSHGNVLVTMKRDMAKAFQCAEKAMASGDSPWATSVCGILLLIGEGAEKDPKRGCEYLQRMADRGYPLAEWALADYYLGLKGNEARGDMKDKGVKLLIRAALKGNLDAMERYASILENGDGLMEKDAERAKFWREKARVGRDEENRRRKEYQECLAKMKKQNRQTKKGSGGQLHGKSTPTR